MFSRVLVAIDDMSQNQAVLSLVKNVAVEGETEVRTVHLRLREMSGYKWRPLETSDQASYVAEAATFELRMAGFAAGSVVKHAYVDRVAQAILGEANAFDAQLIVLGSPRRGELLARLFGSVTHRIVVRSKCPVLVAPRRARISPDPVASAARPG